MLLFNEQPLIPHSSCGFGHPESKARVRHPNRSGFAAFCEKTTPFTAITPTTSIMLKRSTPAGHLRKRSSSLFDVNANQETTDNLTSPTLILSLQLGEDDTAWLRVVRIYGPLIHTWCTRCGLQDSDAADVSQDVLADLAKSIEKFSRDGDGATFRGWLWTITRNKIADHFRRWSQTTNGSGGTGALHLIEQLPDERPETPADVTDLHLRALEGLQCNFNEATWTAFWRVVVEGDAAKDVSEDLGITVWAVYKAKTRVMAKLRAELGG